MTVTLTGKIVAIMAIVAILILGFAFKKYREITNSILKMQDREMKKLRNALDGATEIMHNDAEIIKMLNNKLEELAKAKELDEKMLLPKQDNNPTTQDLEF